MANENLGPAETIIQALLTHSDHMVHNRPGMITADPHSNVGVRWSPVTHKEEGDPKQKVVYRLDKQGKKTVRTRLGVLGDDGAIMEAGRKVGDYRPAGIFPEVATWMYRQVAEVWKLDNEFAAKWASYAFGQEHRDLKVVLAAFMLVQARKGDPVLDNGKIAFRDEDYRDIGEAMMLISRKDGKDLNPKLLLRIRDLLVLPAVAGINRELGFGLSARNPALGRWPEAVSKWLRHREDNPKMLEGLVKAGFRRTVMDLARRVGYKPASPRFFEVLRWKQKQAEDGRRTMVIGQEVAAAETWEGLDEAAICQKIVKEKPGYKRIVGLLPKGGLTRAIMAATIEAGSLSNKDLIILTPTLEDLGLLQVQDIRERWEKAVKAAEDMRAANIAARVKSKETADKLQEAADTAVKKAVEEVVKGLRIYFMVDISGSMQGAIEKAKEYISQFLQGFPQESLHVSVFNTSGREILIKHSSKAGVDNAFRGIQAGGGTDYGAGVRALQRHKPKADEDVLFLFVGDEQSNTFENAVRMSGLNPVAFGLVKVAANGGGGTFAHRFDDGNVAVRQTATLLGIPCFQIDNATFNDPYAIPRTIRNLVAATPVGQVAARYEAPKRVSLVDTILATDLLKKPAWAA